MKKRVLFFILFSTLLKAQTADSLTFSEIMFKPSAPNSEFVEIYNYSKNQSYDLSGLHFKYHTSKPDSLIVVTDNSILPPQHFAIVFEGDYDFTEGIYTIPDSVIILKTLDNAFGSSGMSNSSNRTVRLFTATFDTLSVYTYSANNSSGFSDEKIILTDENTQNNWANSMQPNGTPGVRNSQTPFNNNLSAISLTISPEYLTVSDTLFARFQVTNSGLSTAENFNINFYFDVNNDSTATGDELFQSMFYSELIPGDTISAIASAVPPDTGKYSIISNIIFDADENLADNKKIAPITVHPPKPKFGQLVINEIMYKPVTGEPEWVELYNRTDSVNFNLKKWEFADKTSHRSITDENIPLPPHSFVILASGDGLQDFYDFDTPVAVMNLPTLNNSGDNLKLIDSLGTIIDSVNYLDSWNHSPAHFSLERISASGSSCDSTNWEGSHNPSRATPGLINSVSQKNFDVSIDSVYYNPHYTTPEGFITISAKIKNIGLENADFQVTLTKLSLLDSLPVNILDNIYISLQTDDSATIDFSQLALENEPFLFSVKADYSPDLDTTNNEKLLEIFPSYESNSIIINEVQFAPANGEPEWFELANNCEVPINLIKWRMNDILSVPHSATLSDSFLILQPDEKIVFAKDSSIFFYHDSIPSSVKIIQFPSLSNNRDGVVIKDANGRIIDSLYYSSLWGGRSGKSLERKFGFAETNDSTNWGSSLDEELGTPGRKNSITPFDKNLTITRLSLNPDYTTISDTLIIKAKVENIGLQEIQNFAVRFFDDRNLDSLIDESELIGELEYNNIQAGDSVISVKYFSPVDTGMCRIFAELVSSEDENIADNIISEEKYIYTAKPKFGEVVINEIAYHPLPKHPEWIELFNTTDSTVFNLRKWRIADRTSSIRITLDTILFFPQSYIILSPTDTIRDFYEIDSGLVVVHIPSLNNDSDDLRLIDSMGTVIDSVYYKASWNSGNEFASLEKISPELFGNDSAAWKASVNPQLGTPGYVNSVTQKDFDVKIDSFYTLPEIPYFRQSYSLKCAVTNIGRNDATFELKLFSLMNSSSPKSEIIESVSVSLSSGNSAIVSFNSDFFAEGERAFFVKADFPIDQDTTNNFDSTFVFPSYRSNSVKINEVHFAPLNGEPEWVELQNCSGDSVNLKNWEIGDVLLHPTFTQIIDSNLFLSENERLVIVKDSVILDYHRNIPSKMIVTSFANLNNDADGIVIKERHGITIDSLLFHSDWGNITGASLERILLGGLTNDSTNWGSSNDAEFSTPGRKNSLSPKNFNLALTDIDFSPEFPDSGDYVTIDATVKNIGNLAVDNFILQYYYSLVNNGSFALFSTADNLSLNSGDSVSVSRRITVPITDSLMIKILSVFNGDEDTTNNMLTKTIKTGVSEHALIINEVMNYPQNGKGEWCELINNSSDKINLKEVLVCDSSKVNSPLELTNHNMFLRPDSFIVVTSDSLFCDSLRIVNKKVLFLNFGSLGNRRDALFLFDFRGNLIDSVAWNEEWNIVKEKSIEKISPDSNNISSNWFPSLDSTGATPDNENSVTDYQFADNPKIAINEIMFCPEANNSEYVEIVNYGTYPVEIGGWQIFDSSGKSSYFCDREHKLNPNDYFVFAADSNILQYFGLCGNNLFIPKKNKISLGNDKDIIVIKDFSGKTIDSVAYNSTWHNRNFTNVNNRSLEKISPSLASNNSTNWSSCVNERGGTPLSRNSIYLKQSNTKEEISISPNPFSPDNDGFEDYTIINYRLTANISEIRLRIYDSVGRLVRTLRDNMPSGSRGEIIFDGKNEEGNPLRMGIYILLLEEISNKQESLKTFKKVIVIARKL